MPRDALVVTVVSSLHVPNAVTPLGTDHIRPGRLVAGRGVVDAALFGRRDHALDGAHRPRDVEVDVGEGGDRLVGSGLHPLLEGRLPLQLVCGVGFERGDGLLDGRPGLIRSKDLAHLLVEPGALLEAPSVRLLEVDHGADEVPRHQSVPLDPAGVLLRGGVEQLGAQELAHAPVCVRGLRGGGGQGPLGVAGGLAVDLRPGHQGGEVAVVGGEVEALGDTFGDLTAGATWPLSRAARASR